MSKTAGRQEVSPRKAGAKATRGSKGEVSIETIATLDELSAAVRLFDSVWAKSGNEQVMPLGVIRAISHSGAYVSGAFSSGKLVGALVGLLGGGDAKPHLHSHVLGVIPEARGSSVGYALKQHQRSWALNHGIRKIVWTFDPLVARNAYFNLSKLGADAATYYPDFYGRMDDAINAGDDSDRLLVEWLLDSPKAEAAANGASGMEPDIDQARAAGATIALDEDTDGLPIANGFGGSEVMICKVPTDIVLLRQESPDVAKSWRQAQRSVLGQALQDGFRVDGVSRSGWYLLNRG
jgi:predicted GNAT superfamily acetyltransferase